MFICYEYKEGIYRVSEQNVAPEMESPSVRPLRPRYSISGAYPAYRLDRLIKSCFPLLRGAAAGQETVADPTAAADDDRKLIRRGALAKEVFRKGQNRRGRRGLL